MDTAEWRHSNDFSSLLLLLHHNRLAGDRKLRLAACAFVRAVPAVLRLRAVARSVSAAERLADGLIGGEELARARLDVRDEPRDVCRLLLLHDAWLAAGGVGNWAISSTGRSGGGKAAADRERLRLVAALRDVFGPLKVKAMTRVPTQVKSLALAAYAERGDLGLLDATRLSVLADAVEDYGVCGEAAVAHLRSPGPHAAGCWVVDSLLGKK